MNTISAWQEKLLLACRGPDFTRNLLRRTGLGLVVLITALLTREVWVAEGQEQLADDLSARCCRLESVPRFTPAMQEHLPQSLHWYGHRIHEVSIPRDYGLSGGPPFLPDSPEITAILHRLKSEASVERLFVNSQFLDLHHYALLGRIRGLQFLLLGGVPSQELTEQELVHLRNSRVETVVFWQLSVSPEGIRSLKGSKIRELWLICFDKDTFREQLRAVSALEELEWVEAGWVAEDVTREDLEAVLRLPHLKGFGISSGSISPEVLSDLQARYPGVVMGDTDRRNVHRF